MKQPWILTSQYLWVQSCIYVHVCCWCTIHVHACANIHCMYMCQHTEQCYVIPTLSSLHAYILCHVHQLSESLYGRCVESGEAIIIDNVAEVSLKCTCTYYIHTCMRVHVRVHVHVHVRAHVCVCVCVCVCR